MDNIQGWIYNSQIMLRIQVPKIRPSISWIFTKNSRKRSIELKNNIMWLVRNSLQTSRPCANLDHHRFGPFTILAKINLVKFKLQLPSTTRIHLVFHVSILEPYQISPLRGEIPSPLPPIGIDDHKEFKVEHVLYSRISRGRLVYLVHRKGYDMSNHTWKPIENLQRAPIKV
ncbi:hypothetical protein KP509_34G073900 [Ceratopteris richardii]|uniref:Chromo domain-containing protein n=1 Tax=Ceratopteris richardii TaxID=49495 RepID=A0A8T2QMM2_CERRI|nr:hypothetical protein KP509_34G073900 [Ceratopteris richardii]